MATYTLSQNGDMDSAATFGGAGTPGNGDTIALGGYAVECSSDKRALANGITITGTGKLILRSGGCFKTPNDIPATCLVQFGSPDNKLPAYGSLDANASGEVLFSAAKRILGAVEVYTMRRTGKDWGVSTSAESATETILDDDTTDWRTGDAACPIGQTYGIEYAVSAWDSTAKKLTHAAVAANYNSVGTPMARMSCAAHVRVPLSGLGAVAAIAGGLSGVGEIYVYLQSNGGYAVTGEINLAGKLSVVAFAGSTASSGYATYFATGEVGSIVTPNIAGYSRLAFRGGICRELHNINQADFPRVFDVANARIGYPLRPARGWDEWQIRLVDCELPSPLLNSAIGWLGAVRVSSGDGKSDTLYTVGGVATKTQHQDLPGTTDLPDAYLLAPVGGTAVFDYRHTVRRGQSVRIRFHAFRGSASAQCGFDLYDANRDMPGYSPPLFSYAVPAPAGELAWMSTAQTWHNSTPRDVELVIRAWAKVDNCYVRLAPELGGGAL